MYVKWIARGLVRKSLGQRHTGAGTFHRLDIGAGMTHWVKAQAMPVSVFTPGTAYLTPAMTFHGKSVMTDTVYISEM